MRILFTGGGSGGHFYPVIAVAQAVQDLVRERKLLGVELFYIAPTPFDERSLFENNIQFRKGSAGKLRRYFSLMNIVDVFKTGWGIITTIWQVFSLYPDVVFSKGGYASFPTVFAARLLRIPLVIHETDAVPGRVNVWAGKFARKVAISFPEAASYFPKEKTALTGNPVRRELFSVAKEGAHEFLKLNREIPTILVLGGSQGAQLINDMVVEALPRLVENYQVIHQTGGKHIKEVTALANVMLKDSQFPFRYQPFDFLNVLAMRMVAGAADLVITRGGGTLFEISAWGVPAIIVPITDSNGDHQRKNAYSYARVGGGIVIEEKNLSPNILVAEIERIMRNQALHDSMAQKSKDFCKQNAARTIADALINIALEHER
jgi:UDP-N-acetylglucosamine--N-acetylmuramyl-(pentapeptide) pyrophosphoryl-undecaprenol N-acetylglucosamine transferase